MTQAESDLKYWNALSQIREIGPIKFRKLANYFSAMEEAYLAPEQELLNAGIDEKLAEIIPVKRRAINIEQEYEKLLKENIKIITFQDDRYPTILKEIYAPPALLFVKGNLKKEELRIAIVGTRKYSQYGKQATIEFTEALCQIKTIVVSGLAKGIDTIAHQTCVRNGSETIAVLGSGIDYESIYPPINRGLSREIENNGAIISEYPIGSLPLKQNFPVRNRIISGLCQGVLVVEAPEESGSLITAKYALEQNRELFAVPGPINSANSRGTNRLIKSGAKLTASVEDIIEELNLSLNLSIDSVAGGNKKESEKISADNKEEAIILNLLNEEPIHIDFLIKNSQLPTAQVGSVLTILEIKGRIRNLGGMNYVLSK